MTNQTSASLKAVNTLITEGRAGIPRDHVELMGCYSGHMDAFNKLRSALAGTANIPFYLFGQHCKGSQKAMQSAANSSAYGERAKWLKYTIERLPLKWEILRDPLVPFLRLDDGEYLEGDTLRSVADAIEASIEALKDPFYHNLGRQIVVGLRRAYTERKPIRMIVGK